MFISDVCSVYESFVRQAENVTAEHFLSAIKVLLVAILWAVLPTDWISLVSYIFGAEVLDAVVHYPYGRLLENEADQVGLQLAAKVQ